MSAAAGAARPERLTPSLWRLELPSRTLPPHETTNLYLLASGGVGLLVDPGFHDAAGLDAVGALLERAEVRLLKGVLLTHSHQDHCEGAAAVQEAFDLPPVLVHPLERPRLEGLPGPLKGLNPERVLTAGDAVVRSVATPGHSPGHLAFHVPDDRALIAGDLVAGEGSTWVGLPEGDVAAYLASLDRARALKLVRLLPGHGPVRDDPYNVLNEARRHRLEREAQVLTALDATRSLTELREVVYPGLHEALTEYADASLLAHLAKLMREMRVVHLGDSPDGPYRARA